MTTHPTDDALSDLLDDPTAPSATHVATCSACSERLESWRAAQAALRAAPGLPAAQVDAAVAAAVARRDTPAGRPTVPAARTSGRAVARLLPLAAAAVVAVLLGTLALTTLRNDDRPDTQAALRDEERSPGSAEAPALDGGDLGDIDSAGLDAHIRAALAPPPDAADDAAGGDPAAGGATASPFAAENAPASTAAPAAAAAPEASTAVPKAGRATVRSGPPPCLTETRAAGGDRLGALVYRADARLDGVAVVVLGFRASTSSGRLANIVFAVDVSDCQLRQTLFV